jgi:hypothetical protein
MQYNKKSFSVPMPSNTTNWPKCSKTKGCVLGMHNPNKPCKVEKNDSVATN